MRHASPLLELKQTKQIKNNALCVHAKDTIFVHISFKFLLPLYDGFNYPSF